MPLGELAGWTVWASACCGQRQTFALRHAACRANVVVAGSRGDHSASELQALLIQGCAATKHCGLTGCLYRRTAQDCPVCPQRLCRARRLPPAEAACRDGLEGWRLPGGIAIWSMLLPNSTLYPRPTVPPVGAGAADATQLAESHGDFDSFVAAWRVQRHDPIAIRPCAAAQGRRLATVRLDVNPGFELPVWNKSKRGKRLP